MYNGFEIIWTIVIFVTLRFILPTGIVFFLGDWLKKNQPVRL